MAALSLTLHFVRREISNRYLGSFSGGLWALFQPLIQLAVYSLVFVYVFRQGAPPGSNIGYVPFLALGLWPWTAFSEGLSRATTTIQDNAPLIRKVVMPGEVLVFSSVASSFVVHGIGFCIIVVALRLFGVPINLIALPLALGAFAQLFVLALGFAFLFAALQVFVRDLASALPQLLMLWMFASPIFYARDSLPLPYRSWMDWNPVTHYTEFFRATLLGVGSVLAVETLISLIVACAAFVIGLAVFRRLKPHFEDFL